MKLLGLVKIMMFKNILDDLNISKNDFFYLLILTVFSILITYTGVFSLAVLFQVVTLPVEFDASHRALVMLEEYGILGHEEVADSRKVLSAAAMTYVASAAAAVVQLLRLVMLNNRRRD